MKKIIAILVLFLSFVFVSVKPKAQGEDLYTQVNFSAIGTNQVGVLLINPMSYAEWQNRGGIVAFNTDFPQLLKINYTLSPQLNDYVSIVIDENDAGVSAYKSPRYMGDSVLFGLVYGAYMTDDLGAYADDTMSLVLIRLKALPIGTYVDPNTPWYDVEITTLWQTTGWHMELNYPINFDVYSEKFLSFRTYNYVHPEPAQYYTRLAWDTLRYGFFRYADMLSFYSGYNNQLSSEEVEQQYQSNLTKFVRGMISGIGGFLDIEIGNVSIGSLILIPFSITLAWFIIRSLRGGGA